MEHAYTGRNKLPVAPATEMVRLKTNVSESTSVTSRDYQRSLGSRSLDRDPVQLRTSGTPDVTRV